MKKFNCPSCGAEVVFQSSISVYAVCRYCSSMIVRHDVDVESIGTMAALPDDMSPLQIGTGGFYDDLRFGIIGRMKMGWEDGVWNEWFLYMDDGRRAWLAEAQGSYAISFEVDVTLHPNTEKSLNQKIASFQRKSASGKVNKITGKANRSELGSYITLEGKKYKVVDIKETFCIGSEGELPFAAPKGREAISIDLSGANGEFGSIEIIGEEHRIYLGNYVEWNDMRCQNLRSLEGW